MRGTMIPPVLVVDVQVPKIYQAVHFFRQVFLMVIPLKLLCHGKGGKLT
jgi:hypothetical protein